MGGGGLGVGRIVVDFEESGRGVASCGASFLRIDVWSEIWMLGRIFFFCCGGK